MGNYIPSTAEQQQEMLKAIGVADIDALYADVPASMRLSKLDLPKGLSELELVRQMKEYAGKNRTYEAIFRGAGAYDHYIPSIVKRVTAKEEFVTAYTPYQAEISQGILQSIFEYQTMICELTGMEASNASVYDGATAAAEAAALCRDRKRTRTLVSAASHPHVIQTIKTYCFGSNSEVVLIPAKNGVTDISALKEMLCETDSSVYIQQPNFFGCIEDADAVAAVAHEAGAKLIMGVNPIACAMLKTPGEVGADVAVGEGQPLGMPLSFGGPYLGFMAVTSKLTRNLPGRIVGQTTDSKGNRCFVLTLQAREQHIRREKASSNICSNQALCAMTASVYMASMGANGIEEAAAQCYDKAHALADGISAVKGFSLLNDTPFFHEFVTSCPVEPDKLLKKLSDKGILGGLPIEGGILWCATEKNTMAQINTVIETCKEVAGV